MRFAEIFFVLALVICNVIGQQYAGSRTNLHESLVKRCKTGIEKFSIHMFGRMYIDSGGKENFIISPFSVWSMMTMLAEGAELGSTSREQLRQGLRLTKSEDVSRVGYKEIVESAKFKTDSVELQSSNAIFCNRDVTLKRSYKEVLSMYYDTDVQTVDFRDRSAERNINSYVNAATNGKIKQLVTQDDLRDASILLVNAVFFKGMWTIPFNRSLTKREDFFNEDQQVIGQVDMMYERGAFVYANVRQFKSHVVKISYGKAKICNDNGCPIVNEEEKRLSMIIIVPHYRVKLEDVIQLFSKVELVEIFKNLKESAIMFEDEEVDVYIPRFSLKSDLVLNNLLQNMGIRDVFEQGRAKLTNMTDRDDIFLSRVIHKAQIEVNEEGTVASAVTAGELTNRNTPAKILANKPFAYFILEEPSDLLIFAGTYVKPEYPK